MRSLAVVIFATGLSASDLAQQVIANELRQLRDLAEYTFQYESGWKRFSSNGKIDDQHSESGEAYVSRRRSVEIPLVRNGKPLKPANLEKARAAAVAKLESDAKNVTPDAALGTLHSDRPGPGVVFYGLRMSVIDILRYCKFGTSKPQNAEIEMPFENCQSPWQDEGHFTHLRGSIRVDAKALVVFSWKAWITDGPFAGALFFEQSTQPAPGGIRVLEYHRMNRSVAPHLFIKDRVEVYYRWTKPQRFSVDMSQSIETPKP